MSRKITAVDFKKQYRSLSTQIDRAIKRVLESGWYILGSEVNAFEKELAQYLGAKHVIGVASGTDALTLSLKALELGPGDGVIIPANCYPTAFGVALSGIELQLVDVDEETLNISLENLKKVVNKKTKAVVVVHLYGNPVDIGPIKKYCRKNKIYLIEDCAQAIGAEYRGKKIGTFGDIACFSFYPTKNLGAVGDAGAMVTNSTRLHKKLLLWRMYGEKRRYQSMLVGHNSRMDEIQAAILRVELKRLDSWNKKRKRIAKLYTQLLKNTSVKVLEKVGGAENVFHLFVVKTSQRNNLMKFLNSKNINVSVHYPVPIHLAKSFLPLGYRKGDFPVSEKASQTVLSLPLHPFLSDEDVRRVVKNIIAFENRVDKKSV